MEKTTLRQKSKKELLAIASDMGLKVTTKYTIDMLVSAITDATASAASVTSAADAISVAANVANVAGTASTPQPMESKFPPASRYLENDERELPKNYGDTKIVAMVRDPHWIFVYWEINQEKKQILTQMGVDMQRLILRAYDITGIVFDGFNANSFFDTDAGNSADNWYLQLPTSGRTWCVDLGAIAKNGDFVLIARSNAVITPRDIPSVYVEKEADPQSAAATFDLMLNVTAGLSPDATREERMIGDGSSGMLPLRPSSNFSSDIFVSSFDNTRREQGQEQGGKKDFWLVVNTELIVYGATEPNATLTIQGQPVELRPDGSFSLRFALPDGVQVIPVCARNADGDMHRMVRPTVQRTTETSGF